VSENYKVYLHVFPDGKKYVGCTRNDTRTRWDGGFGYENQTAMFSAICQFGWNNVRHYILFDGLNKEAALLTEAALIRKWKTYRKSGGYNARLPKLQGLGDFILPDFKRVRVEDTREYTEDERFANRLEKRRLGVTPGMAKRVRVASVPPWVWPPTLETGEEFNSINEAAEALMVSPSSIRHAIHNIDRRGRPCTCQGYRFEFCD